MTDALIDTAYAAAARSAWTASLMALGPRGATVEAVPRLLVLRNMDTLPAPLRRLAT